MDNYDIVIIGGGIHGVGVAQAAAAAGHTVLLLEQTALAAGTSSRSSKLIHGGLRYLESMQYALVRQSLLERRLLLKLAPDLVRLVPFYIPIYKTTRRRPWQLYAGLSLYAALGGLREDNRFYRVPLRKWDNPDGLDTNGLQAVYRYYDGQTDDAALTRAVMHSATDLGAHLRVPATFTAASIRPDEVIIDYLYNNTVCQCRARVMINAGGPWVNAILDRTTPRIRRQEVDLVRRTHIRVSGLIASGNWYMEAGDGRAVFVMPREGSLLVGTTESIYTGDPSVVLPDQMEIAYLCEVLAQYFPYYRDPDRCRVLSSYAGLRVLPRGRGRAFDRPRDTILLADNDQRVRVLSIYGGKLTTWRATAAKVMQQLAASLPVRPALARTDQLVLQAP